jgi:hypothetical protein
MLSMPARHLLSPTRAGVVVAFVTILAGPLYSEPEYDWLRHSVSELAAQNTRNAWIMKVGLFAFGAGVFIDYLRNRRLQDIPFAAFGVFIAVSAFFSHKPFVEGRAVSQSLDTAHSILATLAGFSAVLGFVVRFLSERQLGRRFVYVGLSVAYTLLPLLMVAYPQAAGAFQRVIFGSFFIWAWVDSPQRDGRAEPKRARYASSLATRSQRMDR